MNNPFPVTSAKWVTVYALMISAVIGAGIAVLHSAEVLEPWWLATRGYTRALIKQSDDHVSGLAKDQTRHIVDVQLRVAEGERRTIQSRLEQTDVALKTLPPDVNPNIRDIIKQQYETAQTQLKMIDIEIDDLRRQKR